MFIQPDHTYRDIQEKSFQQWLDEMEQHEDLAVSGGVKLASTSPDFSSLAFARTSFRERKINACPESTVANFTSSPSFFYPKINVFTTTGMTMPFIIGFPISTYSPSST